MIDNLNIRTVALDPCQHILQHALDVSAVIAYNDAGDARGPVQVIRPDFCAGKVELSLQTGQQGFQTGALFLQGTAAREMELEHQCTDMHPASLDEEHGPHKQPSRAIMRIC